jgi:ABC-type nitrate/sulfonate/bicarbonate transport system ATPase subunit
MTQVVESPKAGPSAKSGINVSHLSFRYDNRQIFSDFSLFSQQRRVVLKGPSGCGKTTLLKLFFGSLPANPEAVLPKFATSVMVLQEDALFPWLTGRSNISRFINPEANSLEHHPLYKDVSSFIDQPAYKMSYGQRRAIELFRALLYKPEVIYLDEPFNYLDDARAFAFISTLIEITDSSSQLVMTTHRQDHSLDTVSDVFTFVGDPPYSSLAQVS